MNMEHSYDSLLMAYPLRIEFLHHTLNADKDRGPDLNSFDECGDDYQMSYLALSHIHTAEEVRRREAHDEAHHSEHTEKEAQDGLELGRYRSEHTRMDSNSVDYHVG